LEVAIVRARFLLLAALLVSLLAGIGIAQGGKNETKWCTVKGTVVDQRGHAVTSAMVILTDVRRKTLRMMGTNRSGQFTFKWVDLSLAHEIYAEQRGFVSKKILIRSPDARREVVLQIKLEDREQ
jgi:hypothetical protein